ncbi:amidohydrolase [Cellvibrio mixtus]|uniref:Amidohydrolase n=1 Tax=Cellvibrio mixtus TaxID=39650 RepID=A0A266Q9U1_9GAMM|nr:amidohydrolase family protein [Cellvibrio mixtus]OZY86386.1 amidohydrolase [Cellvibrio mixtus]
MRKVVYGLIFLLSLSSCSLHTEQPIVADYVFNNVHIIPMDREVVLESKALAVRNGRIIAIVDQSQADKINAPVKIEGGGRYLMPGLADMHVHMRWNPQVMFNLFLAHGVTTVANMRLSDGGSAVDHLAWRDQIARGEIPGPRYLVSGAHMERNFPKDIAQVNSVLDEHVQKKLDFVKVHGDLPVDIYNALVKGAKHRNLRIIGHAQHGMPLKKTLEMHGLEHMEELLYVSNDHLHSEAIAKDFLPAYRENVKRLKNPEHRKRVIDEIANTDIYIDPTLIVYKMVGHWADDGFLAAMADDEDLRYLPSSVRAHWLSSKTNPYQQKGFPIPKSEVDDNLKVLFTLTKELHDQGVPLLLGTDTFGTLVPGKAVHQELLLLVQAGLTPYEALRTGTVNVSRYLGEQEFSGIIRSGYKADFILLEKNPLKDISNSNSVSGVFTQKMWHDRKNIRTFLSSAVNQD